MHVITQTPKFLGKTEEVDERKMDLPLPFGTFYYGPGAQYPHEVYGQNPPPETPQTLVIGSHTNQIL